MQPGSRKGDDLVAGRFVDQAVLEQAAVCGHERPQLLQIFDGRGDLDLCKRSLAVVAFDECCHFGGPNAGTRHVIEWPTLIKKVIFAHHRQKRFMDCYENNSANATVDRNPYISPAGIDHADPVPSPAMTQAHTGFRALTRSTMLACTLGLALWSPSVMAQEARSGTFKTVQGGVKVVQGDAQRAVIPGAGVQEAERVQTDASGSAVLMLRDGTSIAIGPNTTVDISRFQFDGTTQQGSLAVRVLQGTIRMVTGLLGKVQPDNVKVTTPATTVSVRGTDFIVEVL